MYRDQYTLPPASVALLFLTGFVSAGLAAPFVGVWADQHGRKRLCLVFCATYAAACACILVPSLPVLLVGRILGGVSTSILFSAFESWLVSAAHALDLPQSDLSAIMGRATLVNGLIAAAAGVFSNQLVAVTSSFASPFVASGAMLVLAWAVIRATWTENYGSVSGESEKASDVGGQLERLKTALRIVYSDTRLLVLGLTQTCFEGSMYLFVFLWVPSLQAVAPTTAGALPLGYIFSAFMLSMILGSILYTTLLSSLSSAETSPLLLLRHAQLSAALSLLAALALRIASSSPAPYARFYAFCVFELAVGAYFPTQGTLRGALVPEASRAAVGALFRAPLNLVVVGGLLVLGGGIESEGGAGDAVLGACVGMLALAAVLTWGVLVRRAQRGLVASGSYEL